MSVIPCHSQPINPGVGAGAHGKLTFANGDIQRRWKKRMPKEYMQAKSKSAGSKILQKSELPLEYMLNAMRLNKGFSISDFVNRSGLIFADIESVLQDLQRQELVEMSTDRVWPSARGHRFLNAIFAAFTD